MTRPNFFSWARQLQMTMEQKDESSFPTVYEQTSKTLEELLDDKGFRWKEGRIIRR